MYSVRLNSSPAMLLRRKRRDRLRRRTRIRYGLVELMIACFAPLVLGWHKVNIMPSVKTGLYAITPINGPLHAGELATFRPEASATLMRDHAARRERPRQADNGQDPCRDGGQLTVL